MSNNFLGTGWQIAIELDTNKQIAMVEQEDIIRQSIWIILSTAPGERLMRPDFGCGIHDLVFATNDATTIGRATSLVQQALVQWEPRIDVEHVAAAPHAANPSLLVIEIGYRVRATNSRFNLVYPFYLE